MRNLWKECSKVKVSRHCIYIITHKMSFLIAEADLQKAYAWGQGKYDETVNIVSISCQIDRKLQSRTKTEPQPCFNLSPY